MKAVATFRNGLSVEVGVELSDKGKEFVGKYKSGTKVSLTPKDISEVHRPNGAVLKHIDTTKIVSYVMEVS